MRLLQLPHVGRDFLRCIEVKRRNGHLLQVSHGELTEGLTHFGLQFAESRSQDGDDDLGHLTPALFETLFKTLFETLLFPLFDPAFRQCRHDITPVIGQHDINRRLYLIKPHVRACRYDVPQRCLQPL